MARFRLPQRRLDRVLPVAALLLCAGLLLLPLREEPYTETPFAERMEAVPADLDEFLKLASTDINTADKEALMELPGITRAKVLICAVERGEQEIHIPSGSFRLQAGDRISFVASYAGAQQFFRQEIL